LLGEPLALGAVAGVRPTFGNMTMLAQLAGHVLPKAAVSGFPPGDDFGHGIILY
jgi:hypothetical protein